MSSTDIDTAFRVRTLSVVTLEIHSSHLDELERLLKKKVSQGASFFHETPLLLDIKNFNEEVDLQWIVSANKLVRDQGFIPAGITGGSSAIHEGALDENIICWPHQKATVPAPSKASESDPKPEPEPEMKAIQKNEPEQPPVSSGGQPTQIIDSPVRSGQRIYARGGDLIITSSVNPGGEVMADGNIHIYGSLRGRALAGVNGFENARIFCSDLQAELVAIAGYYTINEDLPAKRYHSAVKIALNGERLEIDPLHP